MVCRVPLYVTCTLVEAPMLNRALASWQQLAGSLCPDVHLEQAGPPAGKTCRLRKCGFWLTALQACSVSEVVLFADADVQVFSALGRCWEPLAASLVARDLDCMFMREGESSDVSGGLLIARATPRMVQFWEEIVCAFQAHPTVELGEQTLVNAMLRRPDCELRWEFLGRDVAVWGALVPVEGASVQGVCFHHAAHAVQVPGATVSSTQCGERWRRWSACAPRFSSCSGSDGVRVRQLHPR